MPADFTTSCFSLPVSTMSFASKSQHLTTKLKADRESERQNVEADSLLLLLLTGFVVVCFYSSGNFSLIVALGGIFNSKQFSAMGDL